MLYFNLHLRLPNGLFTTRLQYVLFCIHTRHNSVADREHSTGYLPEVANSVPASGFILGLPNSSTKLDAYGREKSVLGYKRLGRETDH